MRAAALLLTLLGFGTQDRQDTFEDLIGRLGEGTLQERDEAQDALEDLAIRKGRDSVGILKRALKGAEAETAARLRTLVRRLTRIRVLWTADTGGTSFIASAPAVAPDRLVFVSRSHVTAVDRFTGNTLWTAKTDLGLGHVVPGIWKDRVLVPAGQGEAGGMKALDLKTGKEIWSTPVARLEDSDVCVSGGRAFAGTRAGTVVCLDADSGKPVWTSEAIDEREGFFSPVVSGDKVLAVNWSRSLCAFDRRTGKRLWETPIRNIGALPVCLDGTRAFLATYGSEPKESRLFGVDADTGRIVLDGKLPDTEGAISIPAVFGDRIVVQTKSHVLGLKKADATEEWRVELKRFAYCALDVDDRGRLAVTSDKGEMVIVDVRTGKVVHRIDLNKLPEAEHSPKVQEGRRGFVLGIAGSPRIIGGVVYLKTTSGFTLAVTLPPFPDE